MVVGAAVVVDGTAVVVDGAAVVVDGAAMVVGVGMAHPGMPCPRTLKVLVHRHCAVARKRVNAALIQVGSSLLLSFSVSVCLCLSVCFSVSLSLSLFLARALILFI